MASELQPLSLLFQNRLFRIPDYQRGYAWQQPQLVDFWDDLTNLQECRYHYTGLLSLKTLKRNEVENWGTDTWMVDKGFKPCHIVDGQQRLTTFIILLHEIVEFVRALDENKAKTDDFIILGDDTLSEVVAKYICKHRPSNNQITTYLFGYEIDNPSSEYLRHKIFHEPFPGTVHETYYTKNLKYAKAFFRENLEAHYSEEGMEGLSRLYLKLTLRLMFNVHEIDDDYDVFIAFETMNNRGKKLTNLELLKNRLIYLTTLYSADKFDELDKNNLRNQINDAWKEVYSQLGRNENVPLSDDDFLRAHWISYFSYSRKKGDDYIHFLLNKFSAKNIFEKKTVVVEQEGPTMDSVFDFNAVEDGADEAAESEVVKVEVLRLEPDEISSYVNSLKHTAKYWYDTFFPSHSDNLTAEEKLWVDRLNRIGIGHFRPLIMVLISRRDITAGKRVEVFKAIERFIFICFRLGYFNATYKSSEYYRATRSIYLKQMEIDDLLNDITVFTNINIEYALPNFVIKIEKHFDDMGGFYYWNSIKYFLFEYELHLAQKNNLDKVSWGMFTKTEKDKLTIEHILPQTPTKYYWKNRFRQFNKEEIELLSCALGNLLPLSKSINSSLQNDSFYDKKTSKDVGRRGYENGSHSEIEVSKESDWTADRIYTRSKKLLQFMESRWQFSFTQEQMDKLIYISFAVDGRPVPDDLSAEPEVDINNEEKENKKISASQTVTGTELEKQRLSFWGDFVDFCNEQGLGETIAKRDASTDYWYAITVGTSEFHLEFTVPRSKYLVILIYAENSDVFKRMEGKKNEIESSFGDKLDWYSSRENSDAKRIVYKRECNVFDPTLQLELFTWMIEKFNALYNALVDVGEIDKSFKTSNKFGALKQYLLDCGKDKVTLTFDKIERIIGTKLCKSAYNYSAYWQPSETHIMPNTILDAGYKIGLVDLIQKAVELEKA